MTDYSKLVEDLRRGVGYWYIHNPSRLVSILGDAADAIERITAMYEKAEMDATNLTGKLAQAEAEVERLKDSNEELREKQTYIDHYGNKWMTSAKDVPTAAYEHRYADGRDEAEAQLPKRGKWELIDGAEPMRWGCSRCKYLSWETSNYCPRCGAKMEVQE